MSGPIQDLKGVQNQIQQFQSIVESVEERYPSHEAVDELKSFLDKGAEALIQAEKENKEISNDHLADLSRVTLEAFGIVKDRKSEIESAIKTQPHDITSEKDLQEQASVLLAALNVLQTFQYELQNFAADKPDIKVEKVDLDSMKGG